MQNHAVVIGCGQGSITTGGVGSGGVGFGPGSQVQLIAVVTTIVLVGGQTVQLIAVVAGPVVFSIPPPEMLPSSSSLK
ncbi:MAG TPA: hypothetical protein DCY88_09150 [Cyanobacteria bacterium UBA11372]|nr:hypothetical protein [Cyanobacteria bacterium UBA11372]